MRAAASNISCVKEVAESGIRSIPSKYVYYDSNIRTNNPSSSSEKEVEAEAEAEAASIPIIDLSLLNSDNPQHKAKALHHLHLACLNWGFFMLVNHGIPEELVDGVIKASSEFFKLSEAEKPEFEPKNVLSPIRYGTSFNTSTDKVFCWRDFLKLFVHPHFYCPHKPQSLRGLVAEYCERSRDVVAKLCKAVAENLGVEETEMERALEMGSSLQIFIANYYPPCPNPEAAMGMLPHSDHGLFTLLVDNGVGGLQIHHQAKWLNVNALPNSILVNTADHLEIFSNGKYKSVLHRAVVNGEKTRISVAVANGPSLNAVVSPAAAEGVGGAAPNYGSMKYEDYLLAQQSSQLDGKTMLNRLHIS